MQATNPDSWTIIVDDSLWEELEPFFENSSRFEIIRVISQPELLDYASSQIGNVVIIPSIRSDPNRANYPSWLKQQLPHVTLPLIVIADFGVDPAPATDSFITLDRPLDRSSFFSAVGVYCPYQPRRERIWVKGPVAMTDRLTGRRIAGRLIHLSEGGFGCQIEHAFSIDQQVAVTFKVPSVPDSFSAEAVVRWLNKNKLNGEPLTAPYLGCEFTQIADADLDRLRRYLAWVNEHHPDKIDTTGD